MSCIYYREFHSLAPICFILCIFIPYHSFSLCLSPLQRNSPRTAPARGGYANQGLEEDRTPIPAQELLNPLAEQLASAERRITSLEGLVATLISEVRVSSLWISIYLSITVFFIFNFHSCTGLDFVYSFLIHLLS